MKLTHATLAFLFLSSGFCQLSAGFPRIAHLCKGVGHSVLSAASAFVGWRTLTYKQNNAKKIIGWAPSGRTVDVAVKGLFEAVINPNKTYEALFDPNKDEERERFEGCILYLLMSSTLIAGSTYLAYKNARSAFDCFKKVWNPQEQIVEEKADEEDKTEKNEDKEPEPAQE